MSLSSDEQLSAGACIIPDTKERFEHGFPIVALQTLPPLTPGKKTLERKLADVWFQSCRWIYILHGRRNVSINLSVVSSPDVFQDTGPLANKSISHIHRVVNLFFSSCSLWERGWVCQWTVFSTTWHVATVSVRLLLANLSCDFQTCNIAPSLKARKYFTGTYGDQVKFLFFCYVSESFLTATSYRCFCWPSQHLCSSWG